MCLVSNYLYNKFIGNETKFFSEFKKAINGKLISAILLLGVGISVGSLFLFIPSIIIIGLFSFYVFTYNSDDSNQPLKDAREIARYSLAISLFNSTKLLGIILPQETMV
jgi:hypothetical protein